MNHPDFVALCRQIREQPNDDIVRLVAADWLDEHQEHQWAELIRLDIVQMPKPYNLAGPITEDVRRYHKLVGDLEFRFLSGITTRKYVERQRLGRQKCCRHYRDFGDGHCQCASRAVRVDWSRGFIERISNIETVNWQWLGPKVAHLHPIQPHEWMFANETTARQEPSDVTGARWIVIPAWFYRDFRLEGDDLEAIDRCDKWFWSSHAREAASQRAIRWAIEEANKTLDRSS
jgi:uncharacterized protein (TIGR02996 family)